MDYLCQKARDLFFIIFKFKSSNIDSFPKGYTHALSDYASKIINN